ncbi:MAG TPA: Ig-like domain-containing protein [Gemmatimonadaceae bacterium]
MKLFGVIVAVAAIGALACGRKVVTTVEDPLACWNDLTVTVTPSSATLNVGDTLRLVGAVPGCTGASAPAWHWYSGAADIASVDSVSGLITARQDGQVLIYGTLLADPSVGGASAITIGQ